MCLLLCFTDMLLHGRSEETLSHVTMLVTLCHVHFMKNMGYDFFRPIQLLIANKAV